ncbi:MAG TPA: hypothetical protein VN999_09240 [Thermoanaerobaculia bacterium]|nr:hypothetical protein [Thermoanaerobaculia bacterium]
MTLAPISAMGAAGWGCEPSDDWLSRRPAELAKDSYVLIAPGRLAR